jgi:hypothetical protein
MTEVFAVLLAISGCANLLIAFAIWQLDAKRREYKMYYTIRDQQVRRLEELLAAMIETQKKADYLDAASKARLSMGYKSVV